MNRFNFIAFLLIQTIYLIGCNQTPKNIESSKVIKQESNSNDDNNFEHFKGKFKPLALNNFSELGVEFNDHYLSLWDTTLEVSEAHIIEFFKNASVNSAYYGFRTELPNKSVILTLFNHFGTEMDNKGVVIDTSYFVSYVFNDSGKLCASFRSFGSDLSAYMPTYNMTSTFEFEKDKLIIKNYEYSIAQSQTEVRPVAGSDSIYLADLTITESYLNYVTNEIVPIHKVKSKANVVFCVRNPLPVYLKPL